MAPKWESIRAEYVRGGISYRDLAAKRGVPFDTLGKRAVAEGWNDQRQQAGDSVAAELPVVVASVVLSEIERATRQDIAILGRATDYADEYLVKALTLAEFAQWAAAFKTIQYCRRLALGVPAPLPAERPKSDEGGLSGALQSIRSQRAAGTSDAPA